MSRSALGNAIVVGGGQVALLAAVAIKRASPRTAVTLIATPVNPAALADAAHTTLPSLARLHARLGVDERGMLTRAGASHRLATLYHHWRKDDAAFSVAFGAVAPPSAFRASWGMGVDAREDAAGPAAALAAAQRFAAPSDDPASPLSDLDYALRFSPSAHARRLGSLAQHLGITTVGTRAVHVQRDDDGAIAGLVLNDGRTVAADLFVDASGPAAMLRSPNAAVVSWRHFSPVDRLAVAAPGAPALSVTDTAHRQGTGYLLVSPGRDATRATVAYAATDMPDADAELMLARAGFAQDRTIDLAAGRAAEAWAGNVVAIGDAVATTEPLGDTNLHLAVRHIELLIELLPGTSVTQAERDEFNRRAALVADRTLEFVAAHHARALCDRPAGLAKRLDLFARHGFLERRGEESVGDDLWRQLLTGLGLALTPEPRVRAMPAADRERAITRQRARVRAALALAEPYPAWLSRTLATP